MKAVLNCDTSAGRARLERVFLLSLMLCASAVAQDDRVSGKPANLERPEAREELIDRSCRDEEDRPQSWLDRTHSYFNRQLCEPAAWFDGFFGDARAFEETPVGTFFRLRNSLQWDETEGWTAGVRVRANIQLPRASERLRLLITSDDDLSGEFDQRSGDDDDEDQTRLGLRFIANEGVRSQFDVDGTVRVSSGGLNPRLRGRYRYVKGLTASTLVRATQAVFWEREDGFGTTSRLDWEWLRHRDSLLRLTGEGTFSEESDGVDWRASVTGFQQLTPKTALRAELGVFGYTRPSFEVEEYFVALRYRRQFLRPWLFYELQPEHAWPLESVGGDRRSDWRFRFTIEIQFENEQSRQRRLRRYLDDEEAAESWDDDLSVPVDVPGGRINDPVMKQDEDEPEPPSSG
ncbi:MAG: hypothetical protein AAGJ52_08480 [Pseudomonadota bacterium]